MKKRMMSILLATVCIFSIGLTGCSGKEEKKEEKKEVTTLKIGASPNVIEVVHAMEDSLEKEGYKLEVVAFDDIKQPNVALDEGSLDGNLYQHKPFLDSFNNDNGTKLKFVEPLFGGFTALYSEKWNSVEEIPENAKIGIFQDASNQHRALVLGEEAGLFTLGEPSNNGMYTLLDIKENPRNLELVPLDTGGLNQGLTDLDGCFNQGTSMFLAEKDPTSYIAIEKDNSKFAIGLVVREEDENAEWVEPFLKVFRTEDTKKKIDEYYQGSYVYFD